VDWGWLKVINSPSPHLPLHPPIIGERRVDTSAAFQTLLPEPVPVHHLGLFREKTSFQPVEYYNNLPTRVAPTIGDAGPCDLAIVVDPVIATGGTAEAAIQTLKEWGVLKVCSLLQDDEQEMD